MKKVYITTYAHLHDGKIYTLSYAFSTRKAAEKARDNFITDIMKTEGLPEDCRTALCRQNDTGATGIAYEGQKGTYNVNITEDEA